MGARNGQKLRMAEFRCKAVTAGDLMSLMFSYSRTIGRSQFKSYVLFSMESVSWGTISRFIGKQELSYRKQIARQLRTQFVEGHLRDLEI